MSQEVMEYGFNKSDLAFIKANFCRGCSDTDIRKFLIVCQQTGLNPFLNQIYTVVYKGNMSIQVGIDGFRLVAERTGRYSPGRASTYEYDSKGELVSATSYIKKMTPDGVWHETSYTAFAKEFSKNNNFWKDMPHVMLSKVAESQCLRRCFPDKLSGVYAPEEFSKKEMIEEREPADSTLNFDQQKEMLELLKSCKPEFVENLKSNIKTHWNLDEISQIKQEKFPHLIEKIKLHINNCVEVADV